MGRDRQTNAASDAGSGALPGATTGATSGARAESRAAARTCAKHTLAAGPDGRCVFCRRERAAFDRALTRQADRRTRRAVTWVVGGAVLVAAYALLMASFDTEEPRASRAPAYASTSTAR